MHSSELRKGQIGTVPNCAAGVLLWDQLPSDWLQMVSMPAATKFDSAICSAAAVFHADPLALQLFKRTDISSPHMQQVIGMAVVGACKPASSLL